MNTPAGSGPDDEAIPSGFLFERDLFAASVRAANRYTPPYKHPGNDLPYRCMSERRQKRLTNQPAKNIRLYFKRIYTSENGNVISHPVSFPHPPFLSSCSLCVQPYSRSEATPPMPCISQPERVQQKRLFLLFRMTAQRNA